MEIIAHRGISSEAPENSLPAMRLVWLRGIKAVEIDVRMTADRKIVLCHDPDMRRIAGHKLHIAKSTLKELQGLDIGQWKGERWKGLVMPTLEEVLDEAPVGAGFYIEIKCGKEILPVLKEVLEKHRPEDASIAMLGFDLQTMRAVKQALPGNAVFLTVSDRGRGVFFRRPQIDEAIERAREAGLDGLALKVGFAIDSEKVRRIHAAKLSLLVWTVNDLAKARRIAAAGVDGVITDVPCLLSKGLEPRE